MYKHHITAIETITNKLKVRDEILGVIIGGSIAHGYANENSDVDIMIVLSEEDYKKALKENTVFYFERESCNYDDGYVDGKCTCTDYIKKVAEFGSEPAKFAFQGAFISYSKIDGLEQLVKDASKYPVERKQENINKFYAQFETWNWYFYEGLKRNNKFLMDYCLSNFVLFAGRLILAYNETLFPSYKWFLKVLEDVEKKPDNLMLCINNVVELKDSSSVEALYKSINGFHNWYTSDRHWCEQFMIDSQLNWVDGSVPIVDI